MGKAHGVDLFCGAGGTSAGAEATGEVEIKAAVNHWDIAVETHQRNFPHTKHIQSRLDMVNPGDVYGRSHDVRDPLGPVTTHNGKAIVFPYLTHYYGTQNVSPIGDPLDTITTKERHGLTVAVPGKFPRTLYDESLAHCFDADLRTEFQGSAMGLLLRTMHELGIVDIGFRMLQNHELSAAQGFGPNYWFAGNKSEVTRQIGNSVSPQQAYALTAANAE